MSLSARSTVSTSSVTFFASASGAMSWAGVWLPAAWACACNGARVVAARKNPTKIALTRFFICLPSASCLMHEMSLFWGAVAFGGFTVHELTDQLLEHYRRLRHLDRVAVSEQRILGAAF